MDARRVAPPTSIRRSPRGGPIVALRTAIYTNV